ncbi:UNVERIFIED_CONTAM: hypothetical protein GTU68_021818 [Idotea baltica]|nr:hypothetical protein [Idotea baltica]
MTKTNDTQITVEVVYALPKEQTLLELKVDDATTVEDVIQQSGMLQKYPEINLSENKVGLFGKIVKLDQTVREKDRVEIYRPLIADPKEVRKKRAAEGKVLKKGGSTSA